MHTNMPEVACVHARVQITSLFLHWFPACVVWTERWHPDVHIREANRKSPEAMREWHDASLVQLVLLPCVPYLLWAVLYYTKARFILWCHGLQCMTMTALQQQYAGVLGSSYLEVLFLQQSFSEFVKGLNVMVVEHISAILVFPMSALAV